MYHQLISEQRSQIFALLQKKTARKEIADIVGISQSTLSREIKRNSTPSGKYIWTKAHDMAMQRRKNTVTNAKFSDELVWRIKEYITNDQWSPRQISGYLRMNEGIEVSHQSIYNIIHNDTTGKPPKYLGVPVYFADPYCSWQKGAVENTNKLIRQYIPKKDSFDNYTDKRIMSIQKKLNERPREKLNFSTPKCEFFKHVL